MFRLIKIHIVLILSLFSFVIGAQTRENIAAVWWVGFNNRDDFRTSHTQIPQVLCSQDGIFCVNPSKTYEVQTRKYFLEQFKIKLLEALRSIIKQENPILVIVLDSHGEQGFIAQECGEYIPYRSISRIVNTYTPKKVLINYFINACYSGSAIEIIKEDIRAKEINNSNNLYNSIDPSDHNLYTRKVEILTASTSTTYSYGTEFIDALIDNNKKEYACENGCLSTDGLIAILNYNDHYQISPFRYWRSYKGSDLVLYNIVNDTPTYSFKILINDPIGKYDKIVPQLKKNIKWPDFFWDAIPSILIELEKFDIISDNNLENNFLNVIINKILSKHLWNKIEALIYTSPLTCIKLIDIIEEKKISQIVPEEVYKSLNELLSLDYTEYLERSPNITLGTSPEIEEYNTLTAKTLNFLIKNTIQIVTWDTIEELITEKVIIGEDFKPQLSDAIIKFLNMNFTWPESIWILIPSFIHSNNKDTNTTHNILDTLSAHYPWPDSMWESVSILLQDDTISSNNIIFLIDIIKNEVWPAHVNDDIIDTVARQLDLLDFIIEEHKQIMLKYLELLKKHSNWTDNLWTILNKLLNKIRRVELVTEILKLINTQSNFPEIIWDSIAKLTKTENSNIRKWSISILIGRDFSLRKDLWEQISYAILEKEVNIQIEALKVLDSQFFWTKETWKNLAILLSKKDLPYELSDQIIKTLKNKHTWPRFIKKSIRKKNNLASLALKPLIPTKKGKTTYLNKILKY